MAYTRENNILYLPSKKAFRKYFSLIFSMTAYKITSQLFSFKAFYGNCALAKGICNALPYLPNLSDIIKISREFLP